MTNFNELLIASGLGATIGFVGQLVGAVVSGSRERRLENRKEREYFRERQHDDTRAALETLLELRTERRFEPNEDEQMSFVDLEKASLLIYDEHARQSLLVLTRLLLERNRLIDEGIVGGPDIDMMMQDAVVEVIEELAQLLRGDRSALSQTSLDSARLKLAALDAISRGAAP